MFGGGRLAAGLIVPVVTAVLAWVPVSIAPLALLRPIYGSISPGPCRSCDLPSGRGQ